ncbi:Carboxyl transferase domain protein [Acinetobacter baumannii]|nr:Carboxyl transferase domain protein [Acinetobacter baumannii]
MTILPSEIAVGSEQYQRNKEALLAQLSEVRAIQQKALINLMLPKRSLTRKARFYRMSVYGYCSMLIRLLSNYAVWLATTCMMIKMAPKLVVA